MKAILSIQKRWKEGNYSVTSVEKQCVQNGRQQD